VARGVTWILPWPSTQVKSRMISHCKSMGQKLMISNSDADPEAHH
jgi:hypothetical protein